jgi:hypothetical protein
MQNNQTSPTGGWRLFYRPLFEPPAGGVIYKYEKWMKKIIIPGKNKLLVPLPVWLVLGLLCATPIILMIYYTFLVYYQSVNSSMDVLMRMSEVWFYSILVFYCSLFLKPLMYRQIRADPLNQLSIKMKKWMTICCQPYSVHEKEHLGMVYSTLALPTSNGPTWTSNGPIFVRNASFYSIKSQYARKKTANYLRHAFSLSLKKQLFRVHPVNCINCLTDSSVWRTNSLFLHLNAAILMN